MHQVQPDYYTSEMLVQHCLTTLYARHHGGTFIIRIEDTDRKRHVEDGERSQLENLRWLGMDWDESPETHENYRQSERLELYQNILTNSLAEGKAYKSYVTEEELVAERERQEAAGETPAISMNTLA